MHKHHLISKCQMKINLLGRLWIFDFFSYICNELVYLRFLVLDNTSCCHSIVLLCCSWYWGKSIIIIIIKERMNMYGAQNETYIEDWAERISNLLIYKMLCKIWVDGSAKRNVYVGLICSYIYVLFRHTDLQIGLIGFT